MTVAFGRTPIGKEYRDLVDGLGRQGKKVPEHVWIFQVGFGISLLRVDEVRELEWIADKEDRGVIAHHVIVAFLGVELDSESAWITLCICGSLFPAHRGEADEEVGAFSYLGKEPCLGVLCHIMGAFKVAVCSGTFGVDDTLRDAFPVKMSQLFKQVNVLHEYRPGVGRCHTVLVVINR